MKIWHYHPITKNLIGESRADASPREPEVFLIPAFATSIAPPEIPVNYNASFTGEGWALEEILPPPPQVLDPLPNLPELPDIPLPPPPPPPVPMITARQLRLALLRLGVTGAQVEAQIATIPGTDADREAAMIEWEYATTYQRDHPLVAMLGAALGLTEAQIDAAWMEAATI